MVDIIVFDAKLATFLLIMSKFGCLYMEWFFFVPILKYI